MYFATTNENQVKINNIIYSTTIFRIHDPNRNVYLLRQNLKKNT